MESFSDSGDGDDNIKQAWADSDQYDRGLGVADNISVYLGQKELTFIGHSLGGGIAIYSSLGTGRNSITFDPAWLSKASLKVVKKKQTTMPLELRLATQQNYVPKGFSLHAAQKRSVVSAIANPVGETAFVGKFTDHFRLTIAEVHDMLNIINALEYTFEKNNEESECGCR